MPVMEVTRAEEILENVEEQGIVSAHEEREIELLALEMWRRASCPEEEWSDCEEALRSRASCL